ncbi:hypothetical protein ABIF65_011801 [Bradyrhizobium japonicum]|uniref:Uncharacterized protein n=1 Tax=Bradyrhizobium barranii subsp. barranii TaxID=2823807 RepID=A0A939SA51_9BRAD|nr:MULTISPECIES: hypothetical protein [Bradyrhizobium]MBR0883424.1 hypothetical protein [Bradyrhizobium liaoningense]MBR0946982.1 hypothetical protein [Bradyrhizobium liaoningense]MBR1005085.1 hypothetical protein [Bradyrhizobium liaoningense]MBR1069369.1 hypothetical protein [Bradyrhizobium liaoningense]MCP1749075.1 hypothetical protein [Bradyrhizobium japonicum]
MLTQSHGLFRQALFQSFRLLDTTPHPMSPLGRLNSASDLKRTLDADQKPIDA